MKCISCGFEGVFVVVNNDASIIMCPNCKTEYQIQAHIQTEHSHKLLEKAWQIANIQTQDDLLPVLNSCSLVIYAVVLAQFVDSKLEDYSRFGNDKQKKYSRITIENEKKLGLWRMIVNLNTIFSDGTYVFKGDSDEVSCLSKLCLIRNTLLHAHEENYDILPSIINIQERMVNVQLQFTPSRENFGWFETKRELIMRTRYVIESYIDVVQEENFRNNFFERTNTPKCYSKVGIDDKVVFVDYV